MFSVYQTTGDTVMSKRNNIISVIGQSRLVRLVKSRSSKRLADSGHQPTLLLRKLGLAVLDLVIPVIRHLDTALSHSRSRTHVQRERVTLEEHPQVRVLLEYRVVRDLLDAFLQRESPLLHKVLVKPAVRVLLRCGRHHDARVVL